MRSFLALALILGTTAIGCWVDPGPTHRNPPPQIDEPVPTDAGPTADPPKIPIDTDRTLHASPGAGAGVFITYASGGTWNITWTCDTNVSSGRICDYEIAVNTTGLKDVSTVPSSAIVQRDATAFTVHTSTAATLDSATFHTEPGAPITFSMRLNGQPYSDLVWFMSNGVLSNPPVDPFELVPKTP
ncbi:MAG: hypothetical protein ACXVEF_43075 [Polyangiales bacterium]